ncbi:tRNA (adenosine(37)-N6)-dimethylallyltransferase MiaA [Catalinimonas niigatensis]|uniref:tRNA (adenosine(37)-N6)-dimethylallyltransferase MiaA n=1 Tax=Catalinimonas niigatensis TaxID=1397264 RepID=UPI002666BC5C|nr:tRNA (adenosine(37)-N6)-dimethylallyltransferase MiaA [Catalinimonas niigatensis]WPP49882.1 tRNA (adenosine(37)-N6)-dimethylallyltransferase MiaA [Catalinimonas niigatensis]
MQKNTPTLILLVGPTAIGKTNIAIELALWLGTEIISTDSRQFYKEMNIGTAKPSSAEQALVTHHLVDFLSVLDSYDVKQFEQDALQSLYKIFQQKAVALATGGSGLYVKTLCEGIDEMPDIPEDIRNQLQLKLENEGLQSLIDKLKKVDLHYFEQVDLYNHRRILRALEVYHATGKPYSSFRNKKPKQEDRPFQILKIGLSRNREELYQRINTRVDQMIGQGLFDEVKALYPHRKANALQTVGYQEVFPYLEGAYDEREAIRLIKRNTRRFAKRQATWFRKDSEIQWFDLSGREALAMNEMKEYLTQRLNNRAQ